ncbi:hypothetical protein V8E54_010697 [Elaphomyces granulatus]
MAMPEDLYKEVIQILSTRKNEVLEIEILSPGLGPILQDGNFIGISKTALVQIFTIARHIFFEKLVRLDDDGLLATTLRENGDEAGAITTEIILLFDCEHLTACNWRKRRLQALIQRRRRSCSAASSRDIDPDQAQAQAVSCEELERDGILVSLLERERSLMTTYLCSPLHRHTKSPTLWQHRLWVVTQLMGISFGPSSGTELASIESGSTGSSSLMEILRGLMNAELDVVLRAGEKHPRNYYAFSYMRQLHRALPDIFEQTANVNNITDKSIDDVFSNLAGCVLDSTLTWCLAHLRDISGWTFLLYLLQAVRAKQKQRLVVDRVIQFALNMGWEGESLWTFVDLAVRDFGMKVKLFQSGDEESGFADGCIERSPVKGKPLQRPPWKKWASRAKVLRPAADHDPKFVTPRSDEGG